MPACEGNDVWLIETRHADAPGCTRFLRYRAGEWSPAEENCFVAAAEDGLPLCVWVHGYQISAEAAARMGWEVFERMQQCAPPGVRFRFVIWSWPSLKTGPFRVDAQRKARRSDVEGFKLARLIAQLSPHVPVSVAGFSFGARAAAATLHYLGGGELGGLQLYSPAGCQPRPVRAALLAGALDNNAFAAAGLHGQALMAAESVLVLSNRRDPVLFAYRHLERFKGAIAMGHFGPVDAALPESVECWDATRLVGVSHCCRNYIRQRAILIPLTSHLLYADLPEVHSLPLNVDTLPLEELAVPLFGSPPLPEEVVQPSVLD